MTAHERHIRTIKRWIWSPLEETPEKGWLPIAREYCLHFIAPAHFDCGSRGGYALCHCEMLHCHYEAARQDPRLKVLDDLHSHEPIPEDMAAALGPRFHVSIKDSLRQALVKLGKHDLHFLPEH